MARVNLTLPDELHDIVSERLPGLNLSEVLREGLRARIQCSHDRLRCAVCSAEVDRQAVVDRQLSLFYVDELDALEALVSKGGTAEGAGRVLKEVAARWQLPATKNPLPRPTRAERQAAKVKELGVA